MDAQRTGIFTFTITKSPSSMSASRIDPLEKLAREASPEADLKGWPKTGDRGVVAGWIRTKGIWIRGRVREGGVNDATEPDSPHPGVSMQALCGQGH